jgi:hypothetical protein
VKRVNRLVALVCLVSLVHLVCFVHLVDLVQPNKRDKPKQPDEPEMPGKPQTNSPQYAGCNLRILSSIDHNDQRLTVRVGHWKDLA